MLARRRFQVRGAALGARLSGAVNPPVRLDSIVVNDIHSQLNATPVDRIVAPGSVEALQRIVRGARQEGRAISVAGGRHAMGGQQFGSHTILLDMTAMSRVLQFDAERGLIEVEAGIHWPQVIDFLVRAQAGRRRQWGIVQKQTGADRLSIGGALSANVHGRGLRLKPIVADVESFVLVDAQGRPRRCDRRENAELFRLAIGGYGLFGIIASVTLRLAPRRKLERVVELVRAEDLVPAFRRRVADGFLFGDFQYATDETCDDFLRTGVFSSYRPLPDDAAMPEEQRELSIEDWRRLLWLAHADKHRAFQEYSDYYLSTSGQRYWSDTHQLGVYIDDYHRRLDSRLGASGQASEMITEIYVPRGALNAFLENARADLRRRRANVIYGTIRLIERDDESFLAWAKESYACVIFNLHVVHTPEEIARSAEAFRRLIDLGIRHGGSYYLTYHRFATRRQVEACYPQFAEFLRLKRTYDPAERYQSDWYRHTKALFATG